MSTSSITGYTSGYSLLQYLQDQDSTSSSSRTSTSTSSSSLYSSSSSISLQTSQIQSLIADIPTGDDGKLSFQDVDDYREQLEENWDETVKADLEELGVDPDSEYPLTYNPSTGKVTVTSGHPDKAIIDKYFEDNPDKVEEFQKIIQLGKLTSASNTTLTNTELRQSLQQQAISWWYSDNSDPSSWFDGGGLLMGQQAAYTGLNLTV